VVPIGLGAAPTRVSNTIGHMGQLRPWIAPSYAKCPAGLSKGLQGNVDESQCEPKPKADAIAAESKLKFFNGLPIVKLQEEQRRGDGDEN